MKDKKECLRKRLSIFIPKEKKIRNQSIDKDFLTHSTPSLNDTLNFFSVFQLLQHDMMTELQQFRITVLLVALVVIFLICHTPSVFYLLYKSWKQEHQKAENSILGELEDTFGAFVKSNCWT